MLPRVIIEFITGEGVVNLLTPFFVDFHRLQEVFVVASLVHLVHNFAEGLAARAARGDEIVRAIVSIYYVIDLIGKIY